jgi:hypothetical protein
MIDSLFTLPLWLLAVLLNVWLIGFSLTVLFVIITLDRPFRGPMAISPDSYRLTHDQLMKR